MSTIDILTVFNSGNFPSNTPNFTTPAGSNSLTYSNNNYVRMLSFSDQVSNNGAWDLHITANAGDEIRWLDTTEAQGDDGTDMIIYDFKVSDTTTWNKYLSALESFEIHSPRFYISSGFQTANPKFQYNTSPNNLLKTSVIAAPTTADVTLSYYLKVVKLKIGANGSPEVVGAYGIDPKITIKKSS